MDRWTFFNSKSLHDGTFIPLFGGHTSASASSESFGGPKCLLLHLGLSGGDHLPLLVDETGVDGLPEREARFLHDELALTGLVFLPGVRVPDGDDSASLQLDRPVELVLRLQT